MLCLASFLVTGLSFYGLLHFWNISTSHDYFQTHTNINVFNAEGAHSKAFQYFDTNNNDLLSSTEFENLLKALFIGHSIPKDKVVAILNHFKKYASESMIGSEFRLFWTEFVKPVLHPKNALIIVDAQNDFINGSLVVKEGAQVVPVINYLLNTVPFDVVVYTLDWHPKNHCSFLENVNMRKLSEKSPVKKDFKLYDSIIFDAYPDADQKLWPTHCVQNTKGAELHPDLKIINPEKDEMKRNVVYVKKGQNPDIDSYSAFYDNAKLSETNLNRDLKNLGVTNIYLTGLAADVCVAATAYDGLTLKYRTSYVEDATRAVNLEDFEEKKQMLRDNGALVINSKEVYNMIIGRDRRPEFGYAILGL